MHKRHRTTLATAVAAAVTGGLLTLAGSPAAAEETTLHGDFNADGYGDVVASAPRAHVGGDKNAGQVVVFWGGPEGLQPDRRSPISQASPGVPGSPEDDDYFGGMTTAGDFNGDGITDLVVGAPGEDLSGDKNAGMVSVLWGSDSGLVTGAMVNDPARFDHDRYGKALAAGDFDADGVDDLAIGNTSSTVHIMQGGLDGAGEPAVTDPVDVPVIADGTGVLYLTAGQVDGYGTGADLVVNGYDQQTQDDLHYNANFYYGGVAGSGLTASPQRLTPGLYTGIGDTNGDGYGDLVIGEHWDEGAPGAVKGGKVSIRYGDATGPNGPVVSINQNTGNVPGGSERNDAFGAELHLGDVNADGFADLVVGSAGEDLAEDQDTGSVYLFYGSADGVTIDGRQYFTQKVPGVPGSNEDGDSFGSDVFLTDVSGDGNADLTIGAAGENNGNGAVTALRSDGTKITTSGAKWMSSTSSGISTAGQPLLGINFTG